MLKTIFSFVPALVNLVTTLIAGKKTPKRADEILGEADEPTQAEKAQAEARKRAAEKYN